MKDKIITIRVDEQMKKDLQKLADQDSRTVGDYIRLMLKKHIDDSKKKK